MPPGDLEKALPVIRSRCEEVGRNPDTLRVSVHIWGAADAPAGPARRDRLRAYAGLGLSRAIVQGFAAVKDHGHLERMASDVDAAGLLGDTALA
jgi:hypothetical protein